MGQISRHIAVDPSPLMQIERLGAFSYGTLDIAEWVQDIQGLCGSQCLLIPSTSLHTIRFDRMTQSGPEALAQQQFHLKAYWDSLSVVKNRIRLLTVTS
jgi:hypothetical protein